MRRRDFITLLGAAAAWPLAVRAQKTKVPVLGWLNSESPDGFEARVNAFRQGLGQAGYVEGRNIAIEYRRAGDGFAPLRIRYELVINLKAAKMLGLTVADNLLAFADEVIEP